MMLLSALCPDLARDEVLSLHVTEPDLPLPPGTYHFREFYCEQQGCDCQRVIFDVVSGETGQSLARIQYGWEDVKFYIQWMHGDAKAGRDVAGLSLDPISEQSPLAPALETALREHLTAHPEVVDRIRKHYAEFKRRVEEDPNARAVDLPPAAPLSVPEILKRLGNLPYPADFEPFQEALESAIVQREAITPELLRIVEEAAADPDRECEEGSESLHLFALYLLAQFREPRALEPIHRLFSLSDELSLDRTADIIVDSGAQILASVSGDNVRPILELAQNPIATSWVREQAMLSLLVKHVWGECTRDELINNLREVSVHLGPYTNPFVGAAFVGAVCNLHLTELLPEVRAAFSNGCVEVSMAGDLETVEADLADSPTVQHRRLPPTERIARFKRQYGPIDAVEVCSQWACFRDEGEWDDPEDLEDSYLLSPELSSRPLLDPGPPPYIAPPSVGRNDPCPCGSGKKFKKCCG